MQSIHWHNNAGTVFVPGDISSTRAFCFEVSLIFLFLSIGFRSFFSLTTDDPLLVFEPVESLICPSSIFASLASFA